MKVIFVNVSIEKLNEYGNIKESEILPSYDKNMYIGVDIDKEYDFLTKPVIELENNVKVIKWFEKNYELYLTDKKLELFRNKLMKNLNETISLNKIHELIVNFIIKQYDENIYSLIEFSYEYPGVLLPEQISKESIPSVYMMYKSIDIYNYEEDEYTNDKQILIKQHNLMVELPMNILKTLYGLPTKISQIYRSLFPNTWAQAYFNFTDEIYIHPIINDKIIVILTFRYYDGYIDHQNTRTLLDNIKTVQFLKNHYTILSLKKDYSLNVPFPTIYGISNEFIVDDDNMDIKVSCYHPDLLFGEFIELAYGHSDLKIPGDDTFGYLNDKNAFDPHQYHYILRRLSRYLYNQPYTPYHCIMSKDDLPDKLMYFHV